MAETTINGCVNFDLVEAQNQNQLRGIARLVDTHKEFANNSKQFDTTSQNLTIAQYLTTRNLTAYLNRLEKRGILMEELLRPIATNEDKALTLNSLYILYNAVFFRKMNRKCTSFGEEALLNFRTTLDRLGPLPCLPLLKLLLSKLNFLFNYNMKAFYFFHVEDINRLLTLSTSLAEKKTRPPFENLFFVSPVYGAAAYHLPHIEQNNYCETELLVLHLIHSTLLELFTKNSDAAVSQIAKLREAIQKLRLVPTDEYKNLSIRLNKNYLVNSLNTEHKECYETSLHAKLCAHLDACAAFLFALQQLQNNPTALDPQVFFQPAFLKNGQLRTKYNLPLQNLIGVFNFRTRNFSAANLAFRRALLSSKFFALPNKKEEEPKSVQELARSNNQIMQTPVYYNLALSYIALGNFEQATAILNSLTIHFKLSHQFWYRLGVCHYRLFIKELEGLARSAHDGFEHSTHESQARYPLSRSEIFASNFDNVLTRFNEKALREARELNSHFDGVPQSRNNALTNAIFAFDNCVLILCKKYSADTIVFAAEQKSKSKQSSTQSNIPKEKTNLSLCEYLASAYSFLAFLHSVAQQHAQCIAICSQALALSGLSQAQRIHFLLTRARLLSKLKKTSLVNQDLNSSDFKEKPNDPSVLFYYPIIGGKGQVLTLGPGQAARVYKLISALQAADSQSSKALLDSLLGDFAKKDLLKRGSDVEALVRHLLYFYCYRVRYSKENLEKLLNPLTDLSTISIK